MSATTHFAWGIHGYEWIVILVIALLLFGTRLPSVARSLGKGITEFKKGLKDPDQEPESEAKPPAKPPTVDKE
jgi:sec-independent protein translocase protein TatA